MLQWIICSVVLTWMCIYIEAQCPTEITCAGISNCYMLYSKSNDWHYREPNGSTRNIGGSPPASASKYIYIPLATKLRSFPDDERECLQAGANIVIINNNQEYDQLTDNLLHILSSSEDIIFNVKVDSLPQKNIYDTCGKISVEDRILHNHVRFVGSECSKQNKVNSIICESTDNLKCPSSTTVKPTEKTKTSTAASVTTIIQTSPVSDLTVNSTVSNTVQNSTTYVEEQTGQTEQTQQEYIVQPRQEAFSNTMMMYTLLPVLIVIAFSITALTCFVVVRRRNKRKRFDSVAIVMRPPSTDDVEVRERECNIYMFPDEVKLEDQVSASFDVANDASETSVDGCTNTHQVVNRETENGLRAEDQYTVPKKNAYVCMSNKGDAPKNSKHDDGTSTSNAHYDVPRLHTGEYINATYQEPSPLGGSILIGSEHYDTPMHQDMKNIQYGTPKLSADKYKGNENYNIYQEPCSVGDTSNIPCDTPKLGVNEDNDKDNIYQEPSPLGNGAQSRNDQCDVSKNKKFSKNKQVEKPIENVGNKKSAKKSKSSKNKSTKHRQVTQRKDNSPSINTCEIPVNYEKSGRPKNKEELPSHPVSIEHYDIPKGINEYENCGSFIDEQKGSIKTNNNQISVNEYENYDSSMDTNNVQKLPNNHYDVPRIANEYEDCGDSISKYLEQKGETSGHLSSNEHYDIPKAANEYETFGDDMDTHPGEEDSNKHYEEVRSEKDSMSKNGSSNRQKQKPSKPKPKPRRHVSKTVKHEYMSYESESQNNDYQKLDKNSIKRMKFFSK